MLDPKEVRKRRQEAIQQSKIKRQDMLMEEAQKIFQWILELIDENTKKGHYCSVTVMQYDNSNYIKGCGDNYECRFAREEIFPIICEVINAEDGYHAEYNKNAVYYDENAWSISVTVE